MIREVHRHPVVNERLNARTDNQRLLKGLTKIWELRGWHGNALGSPDRESAKFRLDTNDPEELATQASKIAEIKHRLIHNAEPEIQRRLNIISKEEEEAYRKSIGLELTHPDTRIRTIQQGVIDGNLRSPILLQFGRFYADGTLEALPESLRTAIESSAPGTGYGTAFEHHTRGDERLAIIEHYFNGKTDVKVPQHKSGRGDDAVWEEFTAPEIVQRMEQRIEETAERMAQFNQARNQS